MLLYDWCYQLKVECVFDDDYWKDLLQWMYSKMLWLFGQDLQVDCNYQLVWGNIESYLCVQYWQVLQGIDEIIQYIMLYQCSLQLGICVMIKVDDVVFDGFMFWGCSVWLEGFVELEYNCFDLVGDVLLLQCVMGVVQGGEWVYLLGYVSVLIGGVGWWLIFWVVVNLVSYWFDQLVVDGWLLMSCMILIFSFDSGWIFECDFLLFGCVMCQMLELWLFYVNMLYWVQQNLFNFDLVVKDFNFDLIYLENQFIGVDCVFDVYVLMFGVISCWINLQQGEEVLCLGLVQCVQFWDQQIMLDGMLIMQCFLDLLLLVVVYLNEYWWVEGMLQFNFEINCFEWIVMCVCYLFGVFCMISVVYCLVCGQFEQVEVVWQWLLYGVVRVGGGEEKCEVICLGVFLVGGCSGFWYSVGCVQYSLFDKWLIDLVVGVEYDVGCWVMCVGVQCQLIGCVEMNMWLML